MATTKRASIAALAARLVAVTFGLALISVPAASISLIQNTMASEISGFGQGIRVYRYKSGPTWTADFDAGTHTGTINTAGVLEIDPAGLVGDWWDISFNRRQCFQVNASEAVAEYPIRFEVDTSATASDGSDMRVVAGTAGAELTTYVEGPVPSANTVVWAQAEPLAAGVSQYCVYFDNPAAVSVSDEIGTFTYDSGQTIAHYTIGATAVDGLVDVVSYSDGNTVSDGTTTVTLNAGAIFTFTGVTSDTVITSIGPIDGSRAPGATDMLVPEIFADNRFSFPTSRQIQRFTVRSPAGPTVIEAVSNGVVMSATPVTPGAGAVTIDADVGGNAYVTLRSTDGTDFLATHVSTQTADSFAGVPFFGDSLFGVASTQLRGGSDAATTVQWFAENGSQNLNQAVGTATQWRQTNLPTLGNGRAYRVDPTGYVAVIQQADGNGSESTSFLPERLLSRTYYLPGQADYYTFACPVPNTQITVNGAGTPLVCDGVVVGGIRSARGTHPAGTLIEADNPVFMYYEKRRSRDETNAIGAKSQIPWIESISVTPAPTEVMPGGCAIWISDAIIPGGVFGLLRLAANVAGTSTASVQISTDGSAFYGPDGTGATSFTTDDIVPYQADFTGDFQARVELCFDPGGVRPSLNDLTVEHDLVELVAGVSTPATTQLQSTDAAVTEPILRAYQSIAGPWQATIDLISTTNPGAGDFIATSDHPLTHFDITGGVITQPSPAFLFQAASPFTLSATHSTTAGQLSNITLSIVTRSVGIVSTDITIQMAGV